MSTETLKGSQSTTVETAASSEYVLEDEEVILESSWGFFDSKYLTRGVFTNMKPSIYVLMTLLAIRTIAVTITIAPMLEQYKTKLVNNNSRGIEQGEKDYITFMALSGVFANCVGMIACSKYGIMSDHRGRVFALKICAFITVLKSLGYFYIFSDACPSSLSLLLTFEILSACDGDDMAVSIISLSYVSDIVPEDKRLIYFSLLSSASAGISIVSPLVSSFVAKTFSNYTTLYVSGAFYLLFFIGVFLFLKESTTSHRRNASKSEHEAAMQQRRNSKVAEQGTISKRRKLYHLLRMDAILDVLKPLKAFYLPKTPSGSLIPRYNVLVLLFVELFVVGTMDGTIQALVSYAMINLKWTSVQIGYYMSISSAVGFCSLLLFPKYYYSFLKDKIGFKYLSFSIDKIDMTNLNLYALGVILGLVSPLIVKNQNAGLYMNAIFLSVFSFASPTIPNSVVKYSDPKNTGQIFTAFAILRFLMLIGFPPIFLKLFEKTHETHPALFFIVPTCFSVAALLSLNFIKIVDDPEVFIKKTDDESEEEPLLS